MEPITGGNITGAINATVQAGLAYPALYQNSTLEVPAIILYGTTYDKVPYLIQISGTGKLAGQETRVVSLLRYVSKRLGYEMAASKADAGILGSSKLRLVESIRHWRMLS